MPLVLILALGGGLGIARGFARYLLAGEATSWVSGEVLLGKLAHLSVAIAKNGAGAAVFQSKGKRVTLPAFTADGIALPQGARAMIVDVRGHRLIVESYDWDL